MLDQSRFDLMRHDLHRAASTIQKLKKERDEYKFSYEMLKEDSVSKKDLLRNQAFIESLRDTNNNLQREIMKLRKQIEMQSNTIASLEEKLISAKHTFKSQLKGLKDIENARKELNLEISNTVFNGDKLPIHSQILKLTEKMLFSIKSNLPIHKIFKETVNCNKKFMNVVQSENFCLAFQLVAKFLVELIESFKFCEESEGCSSEEEWREEVGGMRYRDEVKESKGDQSLRLQVLQKKLKETLDEHRMENEQLKVNSHKKISSCDLTNAPGIISRGSPVTSLCYSKAKKMSERPSLYIESPGLEKLCDSQSNPSYHSVKYHNPRLNSSKSPNRQVSPKSRFEEFNVPFRKIQGSASVAECLGTKNKTKHN